jgi:hypothetical protein
MKPLRIKNILALALAGGLSAFAQTNGNQTPGPTDYAQFSRFVAARNIFDPNRQPHYTSSRPRTRTTRMHSPSTPAFTFVGTMSYEKGLFAFFSGNSDELKQVLPVGQKIAGYTVTQVSPGRVTLAAADKKENLQLRIGDVMRQENGKWELSGSGEVPAGDSTSTPEAASAASDDSPAAASSPASEPNDILKKLMEKRAKESQ